MKFFIDTANIEEIKKGLALGMVDGVTTNPSLVAKEPRPFLEILKDICQLVEGPVSAEVISVEADGMVAEARELVKIADNIVIKIPMIEEGLKAVKRLTAEGIKTNVTLIFSASQALLAAKAGATYVSPMHVVESALLGADIATIPYKVIAQLAKHPLTDIGMQQFLADWEKRKK